MKPVKGATAINVYTSVMFPNQTNNQQNRMKTNNQRKENVESQVNMESLLFLTVYRAQAR